MLLRPFILELHYRTLSLRHFEMDI
jgi:hypothetical protein